MPAKAPDAIAQAFRAGALEAILERLDALDRQLESHVGWADRCVDAYEKKLGELEQKVKELDTWADRCVETHANRLDKLEEQAKKSAELEQGTKVLVARMRSLEGRITVLVEMFDRLEDRIGSLEQLREGA